MRACIEQWGRFCSRSVPYGECVTLVEERSCESTSHIAETNQRHASNVLHHRPIPQFEMDRSVFLASGRGGPPLSRFSTFRQTFLRNDTELSQHAERVGVAPGFNDAAPIKAMDGNASHCH